VVPDTGILVRWIDLVKAMLILVATLCGCASEELLTEVTYRFDHSCLPPTEAEVQGVVAAEEMWARMGVVIAEADDGQVAVCIVDSGPHVNGGHTYGRDRIVVSRRDIRTFTAVVAHELGHVLLPGKGNQDHLGDDECGVMSPVLCALDWTADDIDHLATYGLECSDWSPPGSIPVPPQSSLQSRPWSWQCSGARDPICMLHRRSFGAGRRRVAGAQLVGPRWAQRLEPVEGGHQRDAGRRADSA